MKHFRIRIDDEEQNARGILAVSRLGRVVCLRDDQFIVPERALKLLKEMNVDYRLIGEDDPEKALREVRDSLAAAR